MRAAAAALTAALTAATTGCGGTHATASEQLRRGRQIYLRSCAACHTLSGRERGAPGGDLAIANLSVADLASFAHTMPVRPPLTATDTRAVAEYVHAAARRRS